MTDRARRVWMTVLAVLIVVLLAPQSASAATPPNDLFALATELPSQVRVIANGSNIDATVEPGEGSHHSYNPARASVWFSWTAPKDGSATIKVAANFETAVAVYTGDSVDGLTRVPAQPDVCPCKAAYTRIRADEGVTYRIAVDSLKAGVTGPFTLDVDEIDRPVNDDLVDAIPISGDHVEVEGTNLGATQEPGEPLHYSNARDPSIWYSWTAPGDGGIRVTTYDSERYTAVAVYTGDRVDALTPAPGRLGRAVHALQTVTVQGGTTYKIALDGVDAAQGNVKLELEWLPTPANDDRADAQELDGEALSVDGYTLGATAEPDQESWSSDGPNADVWYRWTATRTATVHVSTGDYNAALAVYDGPTSREIMHGGNNATDLDFRAEAGRTYDIQVDSWSPSRMDEFELTLHQWPPVANDDFANAAVLTGASDSATGTTVHASWEPGEKRFRRGSNDPNGSSVWYRWTAPAKGQVTITTDVGSDTDVEVFRGTSIADLAYVDSDGGAVASFKAQPATTYYIRVEADRTRDEDDFTLELYAPPSPPNDDIADARLLLGFADSHDGTTVGATFESEDEPRPQHMGTATTWYRWVAPATGRVTVDLRGSETPTWVAAYAQRPTSWSDDEVTGGPRARLFVTAGREYWFQVAFGKYGSLPSVGPRGPYHLDLKLHIPPANDAFANAQALSGSAVRVNGTVAGATREPHEPETSHGGSTVWYRWTAPGDGKVTLGLTGKGSPELSVYTGDHVAGLAYVYDQSNEFLVVEGTTYRIVLEDSPMEADDFELALDFTPAPTNDDFTDAETLTGLAATTTGTTVASSKERGERSHYSSGAGGSVWYEWTAPSSGEATLDLSGSGFMPAPSVWTGNEVSKLAFVAEQWEGYMLRWPAVRGVRYRIAVDHGRLVRDAGPLRLALTLEPSDEPPPPPNDDFANATVLDGNAPGRVDSTTEGATREPGEPEAAGSGRSVWYRWTAPRDGVLRVVLGGNARTAVYTGASVVALTQLGAASGSSVTFDAVAGRTYQFQVVPSSNTSIETTFRLTFTYTAAPANDDFSDAEALSGDDDFASGTNAGATMEQGESHSSGAMRSVWYTWTATRTGSAQFAIYHPPAAARIAVYSGPHVQALASVGNGTSLVRANVVQGVTYRIAVYLTSDAPAAFDVGVHALPQPSNDDFADATELEGETDIAYSTTVGSTREADEPPHFYGDYGSVWYRWTAPATAKYRIGVAAGSVPTSFNVYDRPNGQTLRRYAASSGSGGGSLHLSDVTAGHTYWIAIVGRTTESGAHAVTVTPQAAPLNDHFVHNEILTNPYRTENTVTSPIAHATREPGEPQHGQGDGWGSAWWYSRTDSSGKLSVSAAPVEGGSGRYNVAIYRGSEVGQLKRIDIADNDPASAEAWLTDGDVVRIVVEGTGAERPTGDATVRGRFVYGTPPPVEEQPPPVEEEEEPPVEEDEPPVTDEEPPPPVEVSTPSEETPAAEQPVVLEPVAPPAAPAEGGAPPAASTQKPLAFAAAFGSQRLATVLKGGLSGTATCSVDCALDATVVLDKATAKRYGLKSAAATIKLGGVTLRGGKATPLKLKLPRSIQAKLKRAKVLRATINLTARSGAETLERSFKVTLKR